MSDNPAYYLVVYRVKKTGKYRTRVYLEDGDLNALRCTTQIVITSIKVVQPAIHGEGLTWLDKVRNYFARRRNLT